MRRRRKAASSHCCPRGALEGGGIWGSVPGGAAAPLPPCQALLGEAVWLTGVMDAGEPRKEGWRTWRGRDAEDAAAVSACGRASFSLRPYSFSGDPPKLELSSGPHSTPREGGSTTVVLLRCAALLERPWTKRAPGEPLEKKRGARKEGRLCCGELRGQELKLPPSSKTGLGSSSTNSSIRPHKLRVRALARHGGHRLLSLPPQQEALLCLRRVGGKLASPPPHAPQHMATLLPLRVRHPGWRTHSWAALSPPPTTNHMVFSELHNSHTGAWGCSVPPVTVLVTVPCASIGDLCQS